MREENTILLIKIDIDLGSVISLMTTPLLIHVTCDMYFLCNLHDLLNMHVLNINAHIACLQHAWTWDR